MKNKIDRTLLRIVRSIANDAALSSSSLSDEYLTNVFVTKIKKLYE